MVGGSGDSRGTARQWAMFDPVGNAQALAEVQSQALRAAGDLVERLAQSVDGARERYAPDDGDGETNPMGVGASAAGDALRLVETWIELLQRASESFARVSGGDAAAGSTNGNGNGDGDGSGNGAHAAADVAGAQLHVGRGGNAADGVVRVELDGSGTAGTTEMWLHNGTKRDVGPLTVRGSDLYGTDGSRLDATITYDPARIDVLPGRSSRGITVTLQPGAGVRPRPGNYRGVVQVDGAPELFVVIDAVVPGAS